VIRIQDYVKWFGFQTWASSYASRLASGMVSRLWQVVRFPDWQVVRFQDCGKWLGFKTGKWICFQTWASRSASRLWPVVRVLD
jgi:hypothetical protein